MYSNEIKQQFLELRAQGLSLSAIAGQLNVSKSTLIEWGFELRRDLKNFKAIEHESLLERYRLTNVEKIKATATILERVRSELEKRTYEGVSTIKLIELSTHLEERAQHAVDSLILERKGVFSELAETGDTCEI